MTVTRVTCSRGQLAGQHRGSTQLIITSLELLGQLNSCKNAQGIAEDLDMKMIGFTVEIRSYSSSSHT